jgi:hypothetical protein
MKKQQKAIEQFRLDMENIYSLHPDRWGHYKITEESTGKLYRLKVMKRVVRVEVKVGDNWFRVKSVPMKLHETAKHLHNWIREKLQEGIK